MAFNQVFNSTEELTKKWQGGWIQEQFMSGYTWIQVFLCKGLNSLVWPVDSACAVLLVRSASSFINNVIGLMYS